MIDKTVNLKKEKKRFTVIVESSYILNNINIDMEYKTNDFSCITIDHKYICE